MLSNMQSIVKSRQWLQVWFLGFLNSAEALLHWICQWFVQSRHWRNACVSWAYWVECLLRLRGDLQGRERLEYSQAGELNQELTSVLASNQIQTKTVAQCVEFYYTYKKQVKIGRNGTLTFGDVDTSDEKSAQEEVEVDIKVTPFPTSAA